MKLYAFLFYFHSIASQPWNKEQTMVSLGLSVNVLRKE